MVWDRVGGAQLWAFIAKKSSSYAMLLNQKHCLFAAQKDRAWYLLQVVAHLLEP